MFIISFGIFIYFIDSAYFHKYFLIIIMFNISLDILFRTLYKNALLQLANAEVQYSLQLAEAEVAKQAWEKMGDGIASDLTLKKPQLK